MNNSSVFIAQDFISNTSDFFLGPIMCLLTLSTIFGRFLPGLVIRIIKQEQLLGTFLKAFGIDQLMVPFGTSSNNGASSTTTSICNAYEQSQRIKANHPQTIEKEMKLTKKKWKENGQAQQSHCQWTKTQNSCQQSQKSLKVFPEPSLRCQIL